MVRSLQNSHDARRCEPVDELAHLRAQRALELVDLPQGEQGIEDPAVARVRRPIGADRNERYLVRPALEDRGRREDLGMLIRDGERAGADRSEATGLWPAKSLAPFVRTWAAASSARLERLCSKPKEAQLWPPEMAHHDLASVRRAGGASRNRSAIHPASRLFDESDGSLGAGEDGLASDLGQLRRDFAVADDRAVASLIVPEELRGATT
jgi:hypothetical protein